MGVADAVQAQAWVPWLDTIPDFKCDPSKPFSQIVVPTADTVCCTYVVDSLLAAGKHVLCVGNTGTGKTLTLMTKLLEGMPPEVQPVFMTFSARTSANQTQDIIGECTGLLEVPVPGLYMCAGLWCTAACTGCWLRCLNPLRTT
jgi:hypothetical protein